MIWLRRKAALLCEFAHRTDLERLTAPLIAVAWELRRRHGRGPTPMFQITRSTLLAPDIRSLVIRAPRIAAKYQAGQFVIVRVHDHGERIPLTIADSDPASGNISLVVQAVGKTTRLINSLQAGQYLLDVVGPLGNPTRLQQYGTVVVIGGGVGVAIAWPIAKALKRIGNRVYSILGARSGELVILETELRAASDEVFVTTDDGSCGRRGLVTDQLHDLILTRGPISHVFAIGPIPMMRQVAATTRPLSIPTTVSLNAIMVDGTGMCGGCRVLVGGQPRFACVDGPEFDAHQVDFDLLAKRNAMYRPYERASLEQFERNEKQDLDRVVQHCRLAERYPEMQLPLSVDDFPSAARR